jgi:hypothetical protein
MKRATVLKYVTDALLQKQALSGEMMGDIDLKGPKFNKIFEMFLNIIYDTINEVKIPVEYREIFFHALEKNLQGWEERAEKVVKSMTPKINF